MAHLRGFCIGIVALSSSSLPSATLTVDLNDSPIVESGVAMRRRIYAAWVVMGFILWSVHGVALEDFTVGGTRPVVVHVPPGYMPDFPVPLVLMLHGYTTSGEQNESYVRFGPVAASLGIFYAYPDGTRDTAGDRFWNATPACCNRYSSSVDDSGYLAGVIREIQAAVSIDPDRIFLLGLSNGGFMTHRMACDHAGTVAAIAPRPAGRSPEHRRASTPCPRCPGGPV